MLVKVEKVSLSSIEPSVITMDVSASFKNSKSLSFRNATRSNLYHNRNVGLQLNGGSMAKLQLLFIVTIKKDAC
jgi:hypothetical protein